MGLLLDTGNTIMIAEDAADMANQLIRILGYSLNEETLACRAAAVLGCDVVDVELPRAEAL